MHALKKQHHDSPGTLLIDVTGSKKGCLRSVRANDHDAALMAKWRTIAWQSFFTWIQPTRREVLDWLEKYETNEKDIIFFVESPEGCPVGQLSLYNIDPEKKLAEFGRLIRGEQNGEKGLMACACATLLQWGFETLEISRVILDVFSDNENAIALYERLGFRMAGRRLYRKIQNSNNIFQWIKTQNTSPVSDENKVRCREVFRMILDRDDLLFPAVQGSRKIPLSLNTFLTSSKL